MFRKYKTLKKSDHNQAIFNIIFEEAKLCFGQSFPINSLHKLLIELIFDKMTQKRIQAFFHLGTCRIQQL